MPSHALHLVKGSVIKPPTPKTHSPPLNNQGKPPKGLNTLFRWLCLLRVCFACSEN